MKKSICGIQQVGIGYKDITESWKWYRKYFSMNVPVFEDTAEACLMTQYTGNKVFKRHAILALNMQGGGGFELWQYKDRTPQDPQSALKIGDYGIAIVKIKCKNIKETYQYFQAEKLDIQGDLAKNPEGDLHFFVKDPFGNLFELIESGNWFSKNKDLTGGVAGVIIGVSNIEQSLKVYQNILGYDAIVYDKTEVFDDLTCLKGGNTLLRRVLLKHKNTRFGGFSKLFGSTEIELIQRLDGKGEKIYQNRFWGDTGFIHVCFDVIGMQYLKQECKEANMGFTVDSCDSFDMGEAAGHFSYIEDPDGTLIEFVETHKVPIIKKLGIYLNLKKRKPNKNLPDWMVSMLSLTKVKD